MNASPIEQWQAEFAQAPQAALDRLLLGRAFMGVLHRNETSEILFRLFHAESREVQQCLDEALRGWLAAVWQTVPESMPAVRWSAILQQVFFTVHRLNLAESRRWLIKHYSGSRAWLRSLYLSPACDPEGCLLRTLAITQENQDLLPFWLRLCRREEDVPRHYAAIGLIGLRKLPEHGGKSPGDLSPLVFSALAGLAETAEEKEAEQFWLREFRAIMALYPRTDHYWAQHFFPFVGNSKNTRFVKLLRTAIPNFDKKLEKREHRKGAKHPSFKDRERILALLQTQAVQKVQQDVDTFLEGYRDYARQTGDSEYLVKVSCEIANKIYWRHPNEAKFAQKLLEEAFLWEPYNAHVWTVRAKVEAQLGRHGHAEALLWEAKRRFPENAHIRTELATILIKQEKFKTAELIYRQTMADFPQDVVCRNGLAEVLKLQGELEKAEQVYRQTMKDFPQNDVCRNGLAEVLKMQGKRKEAEQLYRKTMKEFPQDVVCRNGLAEVLKMQDKLAEAEQLYRDTIKYFPKDVVCRVGLAEVLKLRGELAAAEEVCHQAMKDFPSNVHCRNVLAGVLLQAGKREEAIALIKETKRKFPQDKIAAWFFEKFTSGQTDDVHDLAVAPALFSCAAEDDDSFADFAAIPTADAQELPAVTNQLAEGAEKVSAAADQDIEDTQETALGELNLHRRAGNYEAASTIMDELLERNPDSISIPARLEQGLLYLAQDDAAAADEHFRRQSKLHPNAPSFQLGLQRAQAALNNVPDEQRFQELAEQYPVKETIIRVEQFRLVPSADAAEKLRQRINKGLSNIPLAEHGHEEWFQETLKQTVFKGINFRVPFTKDDLPKLAENCHEHEQRLIRAAENYLLAA